MMPSVITQTATRVSYTAHTAAASALFSISFFGGQEKLNLLRELSFLTLWVFRKGRSRQKMADSHAFCIHRHQDAAFISSANAGNVHTQAYVETPFQTHPI